MLRGFYVICLTLISITSHVRAQFPPPHDLIATPTSCALASLAYCPVTGECVATTACDSCTGFTLYAAVAGGNLLYCTRPSAISCSYASVGLSTLAFCPGSGGSLDSCVEDCSTCPSFPSEVSGLDVVFGDIRPNRACQRTPQQEELNCKDSISFFCPTANSGVGACVTDCYDCTDYPVENILANSCERPSPDTCRLQSTYCPSTDSCVDGCDECCALGDKTGGRCTGVVQVTAFIVCVPNSCIGQVSYCPAQGLCTVCSGFGDTVPPCQMIGATGPIPGTQQTVAVPANGVDGNMCRQVQPESSTGFWCPVTGTQMEDCSGCDPYLMCGRREVGTDGDVLEGVCVAQTRTTCARVNQFWCPLPVVPGVSFSGGCKPSCATCRAFPLGHIQSVPLDDLDDIGINPSTGVILNADDNNEVQVKTCKRDTCQMELGPNFLNCPDRTGTAEERCIDWTNPNGGCGTCSCFTKPEPDVGQCMEPDAVCALTSKRLCTSLTGGECVDDCATECPGYPNQRQIVFDFWSCLGCPTQENGVEQLTCSVTFTHPARPGTPTRLNKCIPRGTCGTQCGCPSDGPACMVATTYECNNKCVKSCADECAPKTSVANGVCVDPATPAGGAIISDEPPTFRMDVRNYGNKYCPNCEHDEL